MKYTVNQLAKLGQISIRTLHYYDEVNLLKPSFIEENGYRYYEEKELIKLQQILFFKELEFSLDEIRAILGNSAVATIDILQEQQKLLVIKKARIENLIQTITNTIHSMKGGTKMNTTDLYSSFTTEELEAYKKEAKERWGHTGTYKQSIERTKHWTKDDIKRIQEEGNSILITIVKIMHKGINAQEVQEQIAQYFTHINKFYDCTYLIFKALGKMYVDDPRFAKTFKKYHENLPDFMHKAIDYYCNIHNYIYSLFI